MFNDYQFLVFSTRTHQKVLNSYGVVGQHWSTAPPGFLLIGMGGSGVVFFIHLTVYANTQWKKHASASE
jgi:hypothetical protein